MNPFEMVIAIVAIITVGAVVRTIINAVFGLSHRKSADDHEPHDGAVVAENRQLREDIRGLKERIAVLERVITDTNTSSTLDREIEKLRNTDR
ncbi:MAG: hypothetical protein E7773_10330 [Sphingomonas sp.]|uniref:hypothetical protein n=1 Tax=Sphingomonas sp. TaxID=28214 RepID=UPI0012005E51|nr:hypothetical protein [Sphingomonas sp.]THD35734.1 MAG: hypothetical protein E7773_10330 [Sphingomonas sp.]